MTGFSFSAAAWPVYGEKQPHADIARGMDVLDAAFLIAQECPGGVAALAQRMGVSANTLQHKLNPNNTSLHLTLKDALALQVVSGLPYVLYAMSAALDHVCLRSRPDVADGVARRVPRGGALPHHRGGGLRPRDATAEQQGGREDRG